MNEEEFELQQKMQMKERAERLLSDPMIEGFFRDMEQSFFDTWKNSGINNTEEREKLFVFNQILKSFKQHFENYIETGIIAEHNLTQS